MLKGQILKARSGEGCGNKTDVVKGGVNCHWPEVNIVWNYFVFKTRQYFVGEASTKTVTSRFPSSGKK